MRFLFILFIVLPNLLFAANKKQVARVRNPASVRCEALYQDCVVHPDISARAKACHGAVNVCKNRFEKEDLQTYSNLEKKCSDIEKDQADYAALRADFCRISLIQYIISN